jgi:hypothetical protein
VTEAEWQAATDPQAMLEFLCGRASGRKLRLFAVACCRSFARLLVAEARDLLEVAERVAGTGAPGRAGRRPGRRRLRQRRVARTPAGRGAALARLLGT